MSWSVTLLKNTLKIPKSITFREDLMGVINDFSDMGFEELRDFIDDNDNLIFNPDEYEYMDYLTPEVISFMQKHMPPDGRGEIHFGALEGDDAPQFWGYEFTGNRSYTLKGEFTGNRIYTLKGELVFNRE